MAAPRYHVLVGAETGLLKGVNTEKRTFSNLNSVQEVSKESEITCLRWKDESESEVRSRLHACGRNVKTFRNVTTMSMSKHTMFTSHLHHGLKWRSPICHTGGLVVSCVPFTAILLLSDFTRAPVEASVGSDVFRMRQHPQKQGLVATGGKENDLKLWDLENMQKPVFQAKNVRTDSWDHGVRKVHGQGYRRGRSTRVKECVSGVCVDRQDVQSVIFRPDMLCVRINIHIVVCKNKHVACRQVVVGNSRGRVALLDLRRKGMVHVFKGMAGSVRSVVCHPTLPLVASCGLDRFFRLHDLQTHMLLSKMYLKSRLNCLLLRTDFNVSEEAEKQEDAEAEPADDEIWQDMEEVEEAAEEPQTAQKRAKKKKPSAESRKRKRVCISE
ncbi:WD-repeat protein, putative [Ixodes scapularis]|uniref:WD-repeat protein, putative n=1 Tax=Ixodes scapularis TaxID=6945 RepID=B7PSI3_IXOSC|nr:WD-repeat protein, putative [Ixodes scapularis]|eukprot:XP_002402620.1 WD-repeat protein, putative [Ixodes scapularis]